MPLHVGLVGREDGLHRALLRHFYRERQHAVAAGGDTEGVETLLNVERELHLQVEAFLLTGQHRDGLRVPAAGAERLLPPFGEAFHTYLCGGDSTTVVDQVDGIVDGLARGDSNTGVRGVEAQ